VPALADAGPLASPTGEVRPAMARWRAAAPATEIDPSAAPDGPDGTRDAAAPDPPGDELMPEERSVAAAPEMASEMEGALLPHPAPAVAQVPGTARALSPTPALKPLDLPTAMVAEGSPAVLGTSGASRESLSRSRPPTPSMKPVVVASDAPPEPAPAPEARAVTMRGQTLPAALRVFWTNLKILLASAPASSEIRAGSGGNGEGATSAIASHRTASSSGNSGPSGSGGNGSPTDGGGSSSAGGGSASPGGGSASAGAGNPGGSSGSAGGGGNSARGGDDGGSVSSGDSRGGGRSDGGRGRGGRGDRDEDDDRGSRGNDRGGRGDGDRGGRGSDRGGDDDDDD
jgi:hypothetical protein